MRTKFIWVVLVAVIAFLTMSCTINKVEISTPSRFTNCDSCYQAQYLIYQNSTTTYDTLMIWSTDTITADSLTSLYSWFNCGVDTVIFDADSIIFNEMKCN